MENKELDKCIEVVVNHKTDLSETHFCEQAAIAIRKCCLSIATDEQKLAQLLLFISNNLPDRFAINIADIYYKTYLIQMDKDLRLRLPAFVSRFNGLTHGI